MALFYLEPSVHDGLFWPESLPRVMTQRLTPLMQQYWSIKSNHEDKILLFRMGDFFEIFYDDAVLAAPLIGIALTSRNKKSGKETPMCGVPHHSIAGPIAKLLAAGHKVALCDQVEDPKEAKGIVKRAVTRILSPGMVYDPETLDELQSNYLASFDDKSVSFVDVSTGEAFYYQISSPDQVPYLFRLLSPTEIVLTLKQKVWWQQQSWSLDSHLSGHEFKPDLANDLALSAQLLLNYIEQMQGAEALKTLGAFEQRSTQAHMGLASTVLQHLEIFENYRGDAKGSLFNAINRTKTSTGARLLKNWLRFPLTDVNEIHRRQDRVQWWMNELSRLKSIRQILGQMGDIKRRLGKISNPNCNPRDLLALSSSLRAGLEVDKLTQTDNGIYGATVSNLIFEIENTIAEDSPVNIKKGGLIKKGIHSQLDELIELAENGQSLLQQMELQEKEATGISSLKIRYNNVFGYYIEVTNTHKDKVPDHYKRKQTLTNAERYVTQDLQDLEDKILSSKSKRDELEEQIFTQLKQKVLITTAELIHLSRRWSEEDVLSSWAWLALEYNYNRPQLKPDGDIELELSRHPVVEQEVQQQFIANTIKIKNGDCMLLTGPNMAGKSTVMRQVAVVAIMAQMGCFIPAKKSSLPLFKCIFTRIGASDYLSEGLSTFMVEMKEAAQILQGAGKNSLVVLDEVGRGTSTYDGMSLAQSILEYLVTQNKATTLFATHYHELTAMTQTYTQIQNYHMAISEKNREIRFLHSLAEGPANKSYGIHVAELAGLPPAVTIRAQHILKTLEAEALKSTSTSTESADFLDVTPKTETDPLLQQTLQQIREIEVQGLTPLEALKKIDQWQQTLT